MPIDFNSTFAIGQKFKNNNGEIYLLCQVGKQQVCLIGLESANRWQNPIEVKWHCSRILGEEMKQLLLDEGEVDSKWELVEEETN